MRFLLPLLLISIPAVASGLRFDLRKDQKLLQISGTDCVKVNAQQAELMRWNQKLGFHPVAGECRCTEREGSPCSADASDLVPPPFRAQLGAAPAADGANCWNAALRSAGLVRQFRHTVGEELDFYLTSPACRELSPEEAADAGDLIVIRGPDEKPVHAFTWISPEVSLTKNGYLQRKRLTFAPPASVYTDPLYWTVPECRRVSGNAVPPACRSGNRATYHRCTSKNAEFLATKSASAEIRVVEAWIHQQEELVSDWILKGPRARVPLARDDLDKLAEGLRKQLQALRSAGESQIDDPIEKARVQALCYILSSLLETIHYATPDQAPF
jgi:hypothetical protein